MNDHLHIITVKGVDLTPADKARRALDELRVSVATYREAAVRNNHRAQAAEAELEAIRKALRGAADSNLVSLAEATYRMSKSFDYLAESGMITEELLRKLLTEGSWKEES